MYLNEPEIASSLHLFLAVLCFDPQAHVLDQELAGWRLGMQGIDCCTYYSKQHVLHAWLPLCRERHRPIKFCEHKHKPQHTSFTASPLGSKERSPFLVGLVTGSASLLVHPHVLMVRLLIQTCLLPAPNL
jgi:hypothetical protein